MFNKWNNLAMKAITGQNSQVNTLDRWNQNAKLTASMFQGSKTKVVNGVEYRTCKFPVTASR